MVFFSEGTKKLTNKATLWYVPLSLKNVDKVLEVPPVVVRRPPPFCFSRGADGRGYPGVPGQQQRGLGAGAAGGAGCPRLGPSCRFRSWTSLPEGPSSRPDQSGSGQCQVTGPSERTRTSRLCGPGQPLLISAPDETEAKISVSASSPAVLGPFTVVCCRQNHLCMKGACCIRSQPAGHTWVGSLLEGECRADRRISFLP